MGHETGKLNKKKFPVEVWSSYYEMGTKERISALRVCGPLTWAELAGKVLCQPVSLKQTFSEPLPLVAVQVIVGEEVLEVLTEQDRVIFPIP